MKVWAVVLGWVVATAGCIDNLTGKDEDGGDGATPLDGPYKVFLAARGETEGPLTAGIASARVTTEEGPVSLAVLDEPIDLAVLAADGTAILVAAGDVSGAVTAHEIGFSSVQRAGTTITENAVWSVPFRFNATGPLEVTLTLDLDTSVANGTFEPAPDSLVAEDADHNIVAQASKTVLTGGGTGNGHTVEPLPDPQVTIEGKDGAFPSWQANTQLNYSVSVPGVDASRLANAFWTFDDGNTLEGFEVSHTYHAAGLHETTVIVHGREGQQATKQLLLDIWFSATGTGEGLQGSGGQEAVAGRDVQEKTIDVTGDNITHINLTVMFSNEQCINAGDPVPPACSPDTSNVYVKLTAPDGTVVGEVRDTSKPKVIEADGPLPGGTYVIRISGDSGFSIGYTYTLGANYL